MGLWLKLLVWYGPTEMQKNASEVDTLALKLSELVYSIK